jgi:hypothetical protein
MRRLLTGYAMAFNRRHRSSGHVFQNRYKSILLAEDFAWRKQHGFPVRWLSRAALKDEYGLTAPAAILSSVAARVDP